MNTIHRLKRLIAIWKFRHGIGKVTRQYARLTEQMERAAFLMEKFGIDWQLAIKELDGT